MVWLCLTEIHAKNFGFRDEPQAALETADDRAKVARLWHLFLQSKAGASKDNEDMNSSNHLSPGWPTTVSLLTSNLETLFNAMGMLI